MTVLKFQRRHGATETMPNAPNPGAEETRRLLAEAKRFRKAWPEMTGRQRDMPPFTWEQLERQLESLAGTPDRAALAAPLASALRKQAPCKPPEMILREVLCLAWTLMDEAFQPGPGPGEEDPMP